MWDNFLCNNGVFVKYVFINDECLSPKNVCKALTYSGKFIFVKNIYMNG